MRKVKPEDMTGILDGTIKTSASSSCRKCNGTGVLGTLRQNKGPRMRLLCTCLRVEEEADKK